MPLRVACSAPELSLQMTTFRPRNFSWKVLTPVCSAARSQRKRGVTSQNPNAPSAMDRISRPMICPSWRSRHELIRSAGGAKSHANLSPSLQQHECQSSGAPVQERKCLSAREKHGCDARGHRARVAVQVYSRARVADPPADALQEVLHQNLFPPDQGKSQILAHFSRPGPEKANAGEEVHTSTLKSKRGYLI